MVNLQLTNNEWYALHCHTERLLKQYPDNRILNSIMIRLAENHPSFTSLKEDQIKQEYHSDWISIKCCRYRYNDKDKRNIKRAYCTVDNQECWLNAEEVEKCPEFKTIAD